MKKVLLGVALLAAVAAKAQEVKVSWLFDETMDGVTVPALTAVSNHEAITGADVQFGSGIDVAANSVPNVVNKDGENQNMLTGNFLGVRNIFETDYPTGLESEHVFSNTAVKKDTRISFKLNASNTVGFYFTGLSMDLCRCFTNGVRLQLRVTADYGDYKRTIDVITEDNCKELCETGGWLSNGWLPSRNDGSLNDYVVKDWVVKQSPEGYSHLVIPASMFPDLAGESKSFTVDLYYWEASIAKQLGIRKVVLEGKAGISTGINEVAESDNANATVFNLAGQRVANDAKGILIKNGKKFVNM